MAALAHPVALPRPPPVQGGPYPSWLGGVAASIAASITHPLDLTKVRLQATGEKSMVSSLQNTWRANGVFGLWDGLSGTLFRQMTYSMCRFWAYDKARAVYKGKIGPTGGLAEMVASGATAGAVAGVVGNVGEVIMVRMQADGSKPLTERKNYKHCFDALFRMTREEGIQSWVRGLSPNVVRSILMNASQLASYDYSKQAMLKSGVFAKDDTPLHIAASFCSGTIATTVCSPADVVKSRIMNATGSESVGQVIARSIKQEGPLFIFKGWVPAWARLQPTTMLIFLSLEQLKRTVDWYRAF